MIVRGTDNKLLGNVLKNNTVRLSPYYLPESWSFNQISDWIADQAIWLSSGITLYGGGNNTIVDNQIDDGEQGILFWKTQSNLFRNNSMYRNVHNFGTYTVSLYPTEWDINPPNQSRISPYLMQDIDLSNTVDGKPIYWWINARNVSVPEDAGFVALINCTEITVQNLQLHNNTQGILMVDATNVTARDNAISDVRSGILAVKTPLSLNHCENNTLTSNNIGASGLGIFSYQSNGTVSDNCVSGNLYGIFDEGNHSSITENIISNCTCPPMDQWVLGWVAEHFEPMTVNLGLSTGLILAGSNGTISRNTISHNDQGVSLLSYGWGGDNRIFHNNFIENGKHVGQQFTSDAFGYEWDDGYPIGGNYWSGVEFSDEYSGSYQNETGSDGIADSVFFVSQNMTDDYPLTAPITTFERTLNNETCVFDVISNSTVMDFTLDTTENTISFNISGESGEGFCRISIPALVMQGLFGGNCTVLVDGNPVEYNSRTDAGYTYVYFSYHLSQHEITIVSEYEFLPQLLSVTATVMILAIAKTKFQKKTSSRYL
jgi:parallel beta-helix repeat protein